LQPSEDGFDPAYLASQKLRHPVEARAEITRLVEQIQKMQRNEAVAGVAKIGSDLLEQVFSKGAWTRRRLFDLGTTRSVHRSIARMPQVGLAADIDRAISLFSGCGVPLLGRFGCELPRNRLFQRRWRRTLGDADTIRRFGFLEPRLTPFEQRVLLDLGIDELGELEVRKLKHFDRLLQLRRHDQGLRLAKLKPLRVTRPAHITLR
jgi:hypothetical protein